MLDIGHLFVVQDLSSRFLSGTDRAGSRLICSRLLRYDGFLLPSWSEVGVYVRIGLSQRCSCRSA